MFLFAKRDDIESMNNNKNISILIAEDDSTLRRMFVMALEITGYQVRNAENGLEAQKLFLSEPPDILVTDLQMPVMDGLSLVEWVRKEAGSKVPILVLTSLGNLEAGQLALKAGANKVGTKPMQLPDLLNEIHSLLPK